MTTKMYNVDGMMCDGCVATVRDALKSVPEVIEAQVHLSEPQAIVSMKEDISLSTLQQTISQSGNYTISEIEEEKAQALSAHPQGKGIEKILGLFHHKKECCK